MTETCAQSSIECPATVASRAGLFSCFRMPWYVAFAPPPRLMPFAEAFGLGVQLTMGNSVAPTSLANAEGIVGRS